MTKKLCLITGASSGIGEALAWEFAAGGWDVALAARRADKLETLAGALRERHGAECLVIATDLADPAAPAAVLHAIADAGRVVDGLVNNAGYGLTGGFQNTGWAEQSRFLQIMTHAPAEFAHRVFADMVARGYGRILNIASIAGLVPGMAGQTLYSPAKAFLIKMSEALAAEAEAEDVDLNVCALCPGLTRTEFFDVNGMGASVEDTTPRALWQSAEEVARIGYEAVMRGTVVQVCGGPNKAITFAARMLPPAVGRRMTARRTKRFRHRL